MIPVLMVQTGDGARLIKCEERLAGGVGIDRRGVRLTKQARRMQCWLLVTGRYGGIIIGRLDDQAMPLVNDVVAANH